MVIPLVFGSVRALARGRLLSERDPIDVYEQLKLFMFLVIEVADGRKRRIVPEGGRTCLKRDITQPDLYSQHPNPTLIHDAQIASKCRSQRCN